MNTFDDDTELEFFEEPQTLESPRRPRRRVGPQRGGPRRPPAPPPGAVALGRLAGLVALAIAVVVGLVFWVGSCQGQSKHDEYASYIDHIRPIAQESARVGTEFANELGAERLTLPGLETKLQQWSRQQQVEYADAQRIRPPGPLQTAHQQVLDTLQLRAIALAGLADTLSQAKSGSASTPAATVASELAAQAQLLTASDIVWTQLFRLPATETLGRFGVTGVIVPNSLFVTNPDVISARSFGIVYGRISSTSGGKVTGLHGSALVSTQAVEAGTTATLSTSSAATVSVSSSLVVRVTFEDSGNYPEVNIPVTLTVLLGGKSVFTEKHVVRQILAKQESVVSFGNLQLPPAAFGQSAFIEIAIGKVPGEGNLANNTAKYPVFFSLAASG